MNRIGKKLYKKIADLNFKLMRFVEMHKSELIIGIHMISREKDPARFKKELWDLWQRRFFRIFAGKAIGVVERTKSGYWHIHLLVVFSKPYSESYIVKDIAEKGRRLWRECHLTKTGLNLIKKNQFTVDFPYLDCSRRIRYMTKIKSKKRGELFSFRTKPSNVGGSFCVSHGIRGLKYWNRSELPSQKFMPTKLRNEIESYLISGEKPLWSEDAHSVRYQTKEHVV